LSGAQLELVAGDARLWISSVAATASFGDCQGASEARLTHVI
jgi:hypothetical protein